MLGEVTKGVMDKSVWEQQASGSDVEKLTYISEMLASAHPALGFS